jgi:predicted metal-dependent phosphoesterase TrpH
MYSEECLDFLPSYLKHVPGVSRLVSGYQQRGSVDFARAHWTPPLTPASALRLEQEQIASLGLRPMVSLTDHDSIAAPIALKVTAACKEVPISVEWTVPYQRAILHLGIHNLPPAEARQWMALMAGYTSAPNETRLPAILRELSKLPEVLIVLNHPFWLEEGVEEADRRDAVARLLRECLDCFHAFELNGTRKWHENAATIELARVYSRPVISGGDRHACEPAACLNLTNAASFGEFVAEIRAGHSRVVFLPHYREPMALRILETAWQILRPYPEYRGRERWTDRVFYRREDGVALPLSSVWKDRVPWIVRPVTGLLGLCALRGVRPALRFLLSGRAELVP